MSNYTYVEASELKPHRHRARERQHPFAVDDTTVQGRLCHVNAFFSVPTPSLEGSFSAPRCQ